MVERKTASPGMGPLRHGGEGPAGVRGLDGSSALPLLLLLIILGASGACAGRRGGLGDVVSEPRGAEEPKYSREEEECLVRACRYALLQWLPSDQTWTVFVSTRDALLIQNLRASLPGWDVQRAAGGEWMPGIGVRRRADGATAASLIVARVRTAATRAGVDLWISRRNVTMVHIELVRRPDTNEWLPVSIRGSSGAEEAVPASPRPTPLPEVFSTPWGANSGGKSW